MNTLLRLPAVLAATGQSRSSLYRNIQQGLMVRPCKIGERCTAWPSDEIGKIIIARIAGKPDSEIRELVKQLEQQRKRVAEGIC